MTSVKDFDPYALTSTQFSHESRSKFSVCWTIVGTIIVIALSLLISYSAIRNIWIPRNELAINFSKKTDKSKQLTTTPLCFSFNSQFIPEHTIQNIVEQSIGRRMGQEELYSFFPDILADIGNRTHVCYDLQGISFIPDKTYIEFLTHSNQSMIHFKTYSLNQILQESINPILNLSMNYFSFRMDLQILLIQATIYDSLFSNSETLIINSFRYQTEYFKKRSVKNKKCLECIDYTIYFSLQNERFIQEISISRLSFGIIVGTVLSWVSVIFTIFAIVIIPFLELKLSISIIKESFKLPKNLSQKPNILKVILSKFIKGIFNEDFYRKADQKLEKCKDIVSLIYLKETIKKFYKDSIHFKQKRPLKTISNALDKQLLNNSQQKFIEKIYQTKAIKQVNILKKDSPKKSLKHIFSCFIKFFDIGTDQIPINYSHGGYRSKKSFILTIFAFLLLFLFFIYVGQFSIISQTEKRDLDTLKNFTYIFDPTQVFFIQQTVTINHSIRAFILNQMYEIMEQIDLLEQQFCTQQQKLINQSNLSSKNGPKIYCFPNSIQLSNQGTHKYIALNVQLNEFSPDQSFFIIVKDNKNADFQLIMPLKQYKFLVILWQNLVQFQLKQLQIINDNNSTEYVLWNEFNVFPFKNLQLGFNIVIGIGEEKKKITTKTVTIFDIINDVWGLTTICFTYILLKLNTFLNKKEAIEDIKNKSQKINFPRFLSKVHLLSSNLKKEQLLAQYKFVKNKMIV